MSKHILIATISGEMSTQIEKSWALRSWRIRCDLRSPWGWIYKGIEEDHHEGIANPDWHFGLALSPGTESVSLFSPVIGVCSARGQRAGHTFLDRRRARRTIVLCVVWPARRLLLLLLLFSTVFCDFLIFFREIYSVFAFFLQSITGKWWCFEG